MCPRGARTWSTPFQPRELGLGKFTPLSEQCANMGEGGAGEALQAKEAIAFSIASIPQLLAFVVSFRQILGFENLGHRFAKLGF